MRINKYFVEAGICSRRKADEYIADGRVTINKMPVKPGDQVNPGDRVFLDGKFIEPPQQNKETVLLAYNKPRGVECTADQNIKNNIIETIDYGERIVNIGRLDKNSEGLIFLSNDGEVINQLTHPRYEHEKEYLVSLKQNISDQIISKLAAGVMIEGKKTLPCSVKKIHDLKITITLKEGRNRQIRKMLESFDIEVSRLTRVRIAKFNLGSLKIGEWKKIKISDVL